MKESRSRQEQEVDAGVYCGAESKPPPHLPTSISWLWCLYLKPNWVAHKCLQGSAGCTSPTHKLPRHAPIKRHINFPIDSCNKRNNSSTCKLHLNVSATYRYVDRA